tara:strand:- start:386 stop:625 length:240 start_codon:yes stop_codon:yes gene_type:complete
MNDTPYEISDEQVVEDAMRNQATTDQWTEMLQPDDDNDEPGFIIDAVETFDEAGIMTSDKGVVLYTSAGTEIILTIQTR